MSEILAGFKKTEKESKRLQKRSGTKEKNFSEVIYKRVKKVQTPVKTFHQNLTYDFLQYIRVIFKWACANNNITRPHLEVLLGLYPLGIFRKSDFDVFCRTVDMNPMRLLAKLKEDGWVKVWRPSKKGQVMLYCLTTPAKILCGKMHKMCVAETKIPEYKYGNNLLTSDKAVDRFYMDVIKRMNKRELENAKDVVND